MLSDTHRQMLTQESGISEQAVAERGYRTVTDPRELTRLGFSDQQARCPGLLIPLYGADGRVVLHQHRPDEPRLREGKPVKYETPVGSTMRLDVPPSVRQHLGNPKIELWITEGAKKADAAASRGIACIALLGVYNFRGRNAAGGLCALGDWESIALNERRVYIAFDSDVTDKPQVKRALDRLAAFLSSRGAIVEILRIPSVEGGKVGLDDYFSNGGTISELKRCSSRSAEVGLHRDEELAIPIALVEAQSVEWLWEPYIPRGELTLLAGDGGVMKTFIAMSIGAHLTNGTPLPGAAETVRGPVLFVTAEDDLSRTLRPRFDRLGGDGSRFYAVDRDKLERDGEPWHEEIIAQAQRIEAVLIVIDPVQAFTDSKCDLNNLADARREMQKMREIGRRTGAAVLLISHLNKMTGGKAQYRVNGSADLVNASRSVLMAGRVIIDDDEKMVLTHAKSNYSALGPTWEYQVDDNSALRWLETVAASAEDISAGEQRQSRSSEAEAFIRKQLSGGMMASTLLERRAKEAGISLGTYRRVCRQIGVRRCKRDDAWYAVPPPTSQLAKSQGDQESPKSHFEHLDDDQVQIVPNRAVLAGAFEQLEVERVNVNGQRGLKL